ncbi:DUF3499 domain-containing protein [Arthrobacter sp. CAN_A212]|uniref:DUF3499 domain-containing protein n=1 Tax=Arthrobacter sp. CAN_A212 TaxID=2787719 RepID=UPI0018C8FD90
MGSLRTCSRSACQHAAVATLTFVYADSTAVLGPLATYAEPHCYDLCATHAETLTVPRGWEVVRLALPSARAEPHPDDLLALVDAVREAATDRSPETGPAVRGSKGALEPPANVSSVRRGNLRILREQ